MTQTLIKTIVPENLNPGDWIFLHGDLGVGKTYFTQEMCKNMGVQDAVTSPTFSLMNIYLVSPRNLSSHDLVSSRDFLSSRDLVSSRGLTAGSIPMNPTVKPRDDKDFNGIEKILHLDLYRLKSPYEICALGLEDEFDIKNTIAVFEWPSILNEQNWEYFFQFTNCQRPLRTHNINIQAR